MLLTELLKYQARHVPYRSHLFPFLTLQDLYPQEKVSQGEVFQNASGENTSELKVYGCGNLHVSREMQRTEHSFKFYYLMTDNRPSAAEISRNYLTDKGGASHDFP